MYQNSSTSSSPIMSENSGNNLVNSFIISNGLISRLSDANGKNAILNINDLNEKTSPKSNDSSTFQKKPFRRLNNRNCEIHNDATIIEIIPKLYERFIEVYDNGTKESCNLFMCKQCRSLLKKNIDILKSHLCKERDIEKFKILNNKPINDQIIFRSKKKATKIWEAFEEVIEPTHNLFLGYVRCKYCLEIIRTSDPKSIPSVLRKHGQECCGEFPTNLLNTSLKSTTPISENNSHNQRNGNHQNNNLILNSTTQIKKTTQNSSLNNSSVQNLNAFIKELSSNNLLNANVLLKNLTNCNNQNNFNLNNLTNLSNLTGLNNINLNLNNSQSTNNSLLSNVITNNNNRLNNSNNATITSTPTSIIAPSSNSTKINNLRNEFQQRCIELCYKELISLEKLNSTSFKRLCQTLMQLGNLSNNNRQLLDTSQLYNQLFTQYSALRFTLKNDLQSEISKNIGASLVCDSQDDLCILATYYINSNWKLKEIVLNCDSYGNEINYFITNTLNDYQLNEEDKLNKFTFLSRGGHFDGVNDSLTSIAHTIDQIINSTIFFDDTYTDLIEKCRLVCNEIGIEIKLESIVENVDWITKYEIMKNVLTNVDKYDLNNCQMNIDLIKFLVNLLAPFRNASFELRNCSKYPTLNHVLLWYYKIMKLLQEDDDKNQDEELNDEDDDQEFIRETKRLVRKKVEEQFELHSLHKIAVFLWPNFRSLKMLNKDEVEKIHDEIRQYLETRIIKDDLEDEKKDYLLESNSKKARTDFSDWEESENNLDNGDEIYRYLNDKSLPTCDEMNLLNWWKDHQSKFPKLSSLAKWVLSIPASVNLIEKFKLQNTHKIDEEILFLHCNLKD